MASVHTMVTVLAFNALEQGMVRCMIFCAHTQEGEGLVEEIRGEDIFSGE